MKHHILTTIVLCLLLIAGPAMVTASELIVITSSENTETIDENDIKNIFLGKTNSFPSGLKAEPINIISSHPDYERFARKVLKKTPSQLKAYWAKRVFTGKGLPPITVSTEEELLKRLKTKKNYISYITLNGSYKDIRMVLIIE